MLSRTLRSTSAATKRSYATISSPVVSFNHGQPTASVTVVVKAGPRYEPKPGVAHCLKNFAFKDTEKRSALRTVRETELFGGVLSTSLSREYISLTADFLPGNEAYFVDLLASQLSSLRFARHEFIESVAPSVQSEATVAFQDPATLALDTAHSLAFRQGLGASLFASAGSAVNVSDVKSYASSAFSSSNVAVIGTGIDEGLLKKLVEEHFDTLSGAKSSGSATTYFGGETRIAPSPDSHSHGPNTVFIGFGSSSPASPELAVLAAHLDPTPSAKWGSSSSPLSKALEKGDVSLRAVYLPYSDASLAGFIVQSSSVDSVNGAVAEVAKALKAVKGGALKGDALKGAVAKARFRAASALEDRAGLVASAGAKILGHEKASLESVSAALEKVDASSFAKATSTILGSKPTFVAVGDVSRLTYADQLSI